MDSSSQEAIHIPLKPVEVVIDKVTFTLCTKRSSGYDRGECLTEHGGTCKKITNPSSSHQEKTQTADVVFDWAG